MQKFVTDYSHSNLVVLSNTKGVHILHCGSLWIQFIATPETAASLGCKVAIDTLT